MILKSNNKFNIFAIIFIIILLVSLFYVIFIYKDKGTYEDIEGSCEIDDCEEGIVYIKELERIKTFEDNYLILPSININNNNEEIININKKILEKFNYYKDQYNKDNILYMSSYTYNVDLNKNILSLVIHFCGNNKDKIYTCEFVIYNIDIKNNKVLSNKELLEIYDVDLNEEDINSYLIYLNGENKLIKIIETEDNFIEKVIN